MTSTLCDTCDKDSRYAAVRAENAKLREQLEYEHQTSRSRLESVDMLKAENAKLRELVRDMHRAICCLVVLGDDYAGEHEDELCALDDRMSELGVEV